MQVCSDQESQLDTISHRRKTCQFISTFVDQTHIQRTRPRRENSFFFQN